MVCLIRQLMKKFEVLRNEILNLIKHVTCDKCEQLFEDKIFEIDKICLKCDKILTDKSKVKKTKY